MNRDSFELLIFVVMFLAALYLLMREFRAYLDSDAICTRASGEFWSDVCYGTTTDCIALNPLYDPIRRTYVKVRSLILLWVLHRCVYKLF